MPIIERKTLDRANREDILYLDAGNLIKAGHQIGDSIPILARYNVSHITVVSLTREEEARFSEEEAGQILADYIERRRRKSHDELRFQLKNTLLDFHSPFSEKDRSFLIPGKNNYLSDNDLLSRKLDSLNYNQVQAGSSRIIDKYKLKFTGDILTRFRSFYDTLKPMEKGDKESKGAMNRIHMNSIRLSSRYDSSRLESMGDSLVNQSIDISLLYMHTLININKKRIIEGRPLSASRWDPSQRKTDNAVYQYKPELILEASIGILLHNIGYTHSAAHQIISCKPMLSPKKQEDQKKIKLIQKSINVLKHLLDREDISSISRMICMLQKDYPDGTGFPSPNENKHLFEFIRLFHIIAFYDNMTNPVITKTVFSRMDVINYMIKNSGEYNYSADKFRIQPKFDSKLISEFLDVLAPYEINEKVYLYEKGKRNHPRFVGKVASYPDSYCPLVSILKDEKNNKVYRDGSLFMHTPSSSLFIKSKGGTDRKKYPWIGNLEIFDKNVDSGNLDEYTDAVWGAERPLHKMYRGH